MGLKSSESGGDHGGSTMFSSPNAVDVSISPNSSVILEPSDSLSFQLQAASSPQAVFTIRNVSESRKIAFKVKTTRPMRYLVRPNQGMLGPNGTTCINVILQQKDCEELGRLAPSERLLSNDKFLVQSIYIDDSFYELVKSKPTKEMADELTAMWSSTDKKALANKKLRCRFVKDEEVDGVLPNNTPSSVNAAPGTGSTTTTTTAATAATAHSATLSSSNSATTLPPHVSSPTRVLGASSSSSGLLQQTSSIASSPKSNPIDASGDPLGASTPGLSKKPSLEITTTSQLTAALLEEHAVDAKAQDPLRDGMASPSNKESLQEIAALRKKYDELVAFTVQLTAQRDVLISDLDKTRQQLQKVSAEAQRGKKHGLLEENTLRQRKNASASSSSSSSLSTGAHDTADKLKGDTQPFGLFHLVVCAIIFFLVGRYY